MKINYGIIVLIAIFLFSCSDDNEEEKVIKNDNYIISKVTDKTIIDQLKSECENSVKSSFSDLILDYSDIEKTEDKENGFIVYTVKAYNHRTNTDFWVAFIQEEGEYLVYSIIQKIFHGDNVHEINYFNSKFQPILSVNVNMDKLESTVTYINEDHFSYKLTKATYGDDVIDCITAHYSKKGWLSVGLFVATAFYPGVAVSVTAACAVIAA
jgi:hypothetical protein